MSSHWIIVADAGRARVLSTDQHLARVHAVREFEHPSGRSRTQELVSDEPGRIDKGGTGVLSAMDPRTDPHEYEAQLFANTIAHYLHEASGRREFSKLTLVAPPHFLGLLKARISSQVERRLAACVCKDLTNMNTETLSNYLRTHQGE